MVSPEVFKHYALDNLFFDQHHEDIIDQLNVVRNTRDFSTLPACLESLKAHHESEEDCMAAILYPYLRYHVTSHRALEARLTRLIQYADVCMIGDFQRMFLDHIDVYDRQVQEYIKGHS